MAEPDGQPDGVITIIGKSRMVSVGADVNLTLSSYVTRITGYASPISLGIGTADHGKIKKVYNNTGGDVVINSDISVQGAATDTITITTGGFIELVYLLDPDITERFREVDGTGYTLS